MVVDKHSQDALAKLYAEWISAGMKMSLAGFTASLKILEATGQSVTSARAKANEAIRAREAQPEAKPANTAQPAPSIKPVVASKPVAKTANVVTMKPKLVEPAAAPKPRADGKVDDLKRISGIGPKLEQLLNGKGITSFASIAALKADELAKLDADLNLNGRIQRDDWFGQASKLARA